MHKFKIILLLEKGLTWPTYVWSVDAVEIESTLLNSHRKTVGYLINNCKNTIQLEYLHKSTEETIINSAGEILNDQTLKIDSVYVDDILLDQQFLFDHSEYNPNYRLDFINYCNENNIKLQTGPHQSTKFWHSGTWNFEFENNFWAWYSLKRKTLNSLTVDQVSKYLGQSAEQIQIQLDDLKKYLT